MGVAAPVGAVVGVSGEKSNRLTDTEHAGITAALFALIAAIIGNIWFSDEDELKTLRTENKELKLKAEKPIFKKRTKRTGHFVAPEHKKQGKLKGSYYHDKIDEWVPDGTGKLYHQDQRVIPIKNESKE